VPYLCGVEYWTSQPANNQGTFGQKRPTLATYLILKIIPLSFEKKRKKRIG